MFRNMIIGEIETKLLRSVFAMLKILDFNLKAIKKLEEDMSDIGKTYKWQIIGILNT